MHTFFFQKKTINVTDTDLNTQSLNNATASRTR